MKKILTLLPLIMLLMGCSNEVEDNKYAYLEYKNKLQEQENFNEEEEIDFNTFFNIERINDELVNYSIVINDPKIDMYEVKALLVHDYHQEGTFPSVGILDNPVNLIKDSDDKIELKGTIQTTEDLSNVKFKLYLEYLDDNDLSNKIYYQVARG